MKFKYEMFRHVLPIILSEPFCNWAGPPWRQFWGSGQFSEPPWCRHTWTSNSWVWCMRSASLHGWSYVTVGSPLQSLALAAENNGLHSNFSAVSTGIPRACWDIWLLWHFDIILDLLRKTTLPKTMVCIPKIPQIICPGPGPAVSSARTFRNPDPLVNVPRLHLAMIHVDETVQILKNRFI